MQCVYEPHIAAMGFVRDKSIVDNAKLHVGSNYVYNIDLKDFFPSVDQARVWKCLQLKPFSLNMESSVEPQYMKWEDFKKEYLKTDKPVQFLKGKGRMFTNTEYGPIFVANSFDITKDKYILLGSNNLKTIKGKSLEGSLWLVNKIPNTSRLDIANIIASLCCTEMEVERKNESGDWEKVKLNVLPQGAPTSPVITNMVCQKLDYLLTGVAKRFGLKYSRYADDITFSSMHNVYKPQSEFLRELHRIIANQNFHIKESKTRLQKDGYRKEVTGLLVNEKVNVQQRYIKQLRMWLYYWERYGYERASEFFLKQYISDKGHVKSRKPDMASVITGKLDYLKMVKGEDSELYLKLKNRFRNITSKNIESKNISEIEILPELDYSQFKITLEVYQSPELKGFLNQSLSIPKNTVLPSTIILSNPSRQISTQKGSINSLYPITHNPSKTVELLKYFTANDKDLKYSTHSWEEGKYNNYDDYIEKIKREWSEIDRLLENQSSRLHAKIWAFLFDNKLGQKKENGYYHVWDEKRLKFGWSSPELKMHMEETGNSPFSCPIPRNIQEVDKKYNLIYFKDYADIFKNEIEFREDSNNFKKMISDLWKTELTYDFDIDGLKNLVGFSFFTDVNYVKDTMRILFSDLFKIKPEFPKIIIEKISNFENEGYHLIRITQKDSFVTREIDDPKFTNPTGNLYSMIKNLRNLADYSIISRFADGKSYKLNYLNSNNSLFIEELDLTIEVIGFTHEFKFYL